MNTIALTIEQLRTMMERQYTLVYLDRSCNLNNSADILSECIKEKSATPLYDHVSDWFVGAEYDRIAEIVEELKTTCSEQGYTSEQIEEFFAEYEDAIREEIQSRDDSDIVATLLRNTDDIPIRIEMHSNYDCINSHYFEGEYTYTQSYFGDMVDWLNLNPHEVEKIFRENGLQCEGECPNRAERNGNEMVSYLQFAQEISNSVSPANLLTIMATINVTELFKAEFTIGQVTIPKGNRCGLFSPSYGGGSVMEMELQRDVKLSLKGTTNYDYFSLQFDVNTERGYALKDVYGVVDSFFGKAVTIHKEDLMFCHLGNGVTVCDRFREQNNDYVKVAHISTDRQVTYYNTISDEGKARIEQFAKYDNMSQSFTQPYPVLNPIK